VGRHAKERLRAMSDEEQDYLGQLSRASSAQAGQVVRARLLLHVAAGVGYGAAAAAEGRRSGEAVGRGWYMGQRNGPALWPSCSGHPIERVIARRRGR